MEIKEAWADPPPALPVSWSNPATLESYDTYRVFNGRRWNAVNCEELPRYFSALTELLAAETLRGNARSYYLATYMVCLFSLEGPEQEWVVTDIEMFLSRAVEAPVQLGMTPARCRALAHFLELKRADFERWDVFIADEWAKIAASMRES